MTGRRPFSSVKMLFCMAFAAPGLVIAQQYDPSHFVVFLVATAGALVGAGVYHLARPIWERGSKDDLDNA